MNGKTQPNKRLEGTRRVSSLYSQLRGRADPVQRWLAWNSYGKKLLFARRSNCGWAQTATARANMPSMCATIPIFEELSEADEQRIRECIRQNRHFMAIEELRAATGCSLEWAKLWVEHDGRPKPAKAPIPCPYCGMPLRTSLAKVCRFCSRDWHDEKNVVFLRAS